MKGGDADLHGPVYVIHWISALLWQIKSHIHYERMTTRATLSLPKKIFKHEASLLFSSFPCWISCTNLGTINIFSLKNNVPKRIYYSLSSGADHFYSTHYRIPRPLDFVKLVCAGEALPLCN